MGIGFVVKEQKPMAMGYDCRISCQSLLWCLWHDISSLLDCSAAFYLVDHSSLLHRIEHHLDVIGKSLDWFQSYLCNMTQCVSINGRTSPAHQLFCCVPQGSLLGPRLFTIYTLPLGDIIHTHDVNFHLYADNTQLCVALWDTARSRHMYCWYLTMHASRWLEAQWQ